MFIYITKATLRCVIVDSLKKLRHHQHTQIVVLQRHLSDAEFEAILQIGRQDFYRLPQWRRNELKRRARLF